VDEGEEEREGGREIREVTVKMGCSIVHVRVIALL
jgi:hypothetical protein